MKKKIIMIAMLSALISTPVLAESIDSAGINRDTQKFEISGSLGSEWANKKVTIAILNKDVTPEELDTATNDNIGDILYGIYDTYTEEDGSYSFVQSFSAPSGTYYALINPSAKGEKPASKLFKHFNADEIEVLLSKLEECRKNHDYTGIKNLMTDFNREMLGLPERLYGNLGFSDFDDIAFKCLANSANKYETTKAFADEYAKAGVVNAFNRLSDYSKTEELLNECDEYLNVAGTDVYKLFEKMDSTDKTTIEKCFSDKTDFISIEQIIDLFNGKVLLKTNENFENWTQFNPFITKYYSYLGIDITDYNKLGTKKSTVDKEIVGKGFENSESFKKAFNAAVNSAKSGSNASTPGSSPGSGTNSTGPKIRIDNTVTVPSVTPNTENRFNDVSASHWAYEAITALAKKGVVSGKENNTFDPDSAVSRKEAAKIIVLAFGIRNNSEEVGLVDVTADDWAYSYISAAYSNNIVSGDENGRFNPNADVTRQDLAVLIYRAAAAAGKQIKTGDKKNEFSDGSSVSDYAVEAVEKLSAAGIINGFDNGTFAPKQMCTRAQLAKMIYEIIK